MSEISRSRPIARTTHRCWGCRDEIKPGTRYEVIVWAEEGQIGSVAWCPLCTWFLAEDPEFFSFDGGPPYLYDEGCVEEHMSEWHHEGRPLPPEDYKLKPLPGLQLPRLTKSDRHLLSQLRALVDDPDWSPPYYIPLRDTDMLPKQALRAAKRLQAHGHKVRVWIEIHYDIDTEE